MALCRRVLLNVWVPVSRQAVLGSRRWAAKNGPRQLFHLRQCRMTFYSTLVPSDDVTVEYKHGFPVISIMLPSRKERCQFLVKPLLMNVGDLLEDLKNEDRGINSAAIFSEDGTRVSAATPISILLTNNFELVINETKYFVKPPTKDHSEPSVEMDNVKSLVHRLYVALHAENHLLHKEGQLLEKLENLKGELQNLEQIKSQLFLKAEAKSSRLMWVGLALMSTQAGALAWLTWWVYSWDIMEPVTYFITYGSSMAFYAYFLLTRQDCVYPDVKDRQFLHYFHRGAKRNRFDIEKYNKIKEELAEVETNLRRLRNPLQLKLPLEQLNGKD
ncbi:calcium uniporter regulatory subunit MCUb, mitochondrial-like isoform X2 [Scyliorhinus canicula]|uniref:calcium uniporter regulatory subunit MCUb, mitochondrial-like isoform X2 n=1 Tax=Scyliorhinus canicula TaxID=7830 RepID=UPI0018F741B0|nr:calcium uniporter regulatory subunit MCUb, mitochondrial-like isoform X2 [Scyliorhinus canicula]